MNREQKPTTPWTQRQPTGPGVPGGRGGSTGSGHRGRRGGPSPYYPNKSNGQKTPFNRTGGSRPNYYEAIRERLNYSLKKLGGLVVTVKKLNGVVFEGVCITSTGETNLNKGVLLRYAVVKEKPEGVSDPTAVAADRLFIDSIDIMTIDARDVDQKLKEGEGAEHQLKVDSDIARSKVQKGQLAGRPLENVNSAWLQHEVPNDGFDGQKGIGKWDQFKTNEEKFGVKNTYDENLYTSKLNKKTLTKEQIDHAERTAKAIEGQDSDNIHLKEERNQIMQQEVDEETQYSAVQRPSATANGSSGPVKLSFAEMLKKSQTAKERIPPPPPPKEQLNSLRSTTTTSSQNSNLPVSVNDAKVSAPVNMTTPLKVNGSTKEATPAGSGEKGSDKATPSEKYKVSSINFEKYIKDREEKLRMTVNPKAAEKSARKPIQKSRETEIAEFKAFSSRLNVKTSTSGSPKASPPQLPIKDESKSKLNANAQEFRPKFIQKHDSNPKIAIPSHGPPPPPAPVPDAQNHQTQGQPPVPNNIQNQGPARQNSNVSQMTNNSQQNMPQNAAPQFMHPGMIPMPQVHMMPQFQQGFQPMQMMPQMVMFPPNMQMGQMPHPQMQQMPHFIQPGGAPMMMHQIPGQQPYFLPMMPGQMGQPPQQNTQQPQFMPRVMYANYQQSPPSQMGEAPRGQ